MSQSFVLRFSFGFSAGWFFFFLSILYNVNNWKSPPVNSTNMRESTSRVNISLLFPRSLNNLHVSATFPLVNVLVLSVLAVVVYANSKKKDIPTIDGNQQISESLEKDVNHWVISVAWGTLFYAATTLVGSVIRGCEKYWSEHRLLRHQFSEDVKGAAFAVGALVASTNYLFTTLGKERMTPLVVLGVVIALLGDKAYEELSKFQSTGPSIHASFRRDARNETVSATEVAIQPQTRVSTDSTTRD